MRRVTWAGTRSAKRPVERQIPARADASSPANFSWSMKVRSPGPARSSGAIPVMRRSSFAPACGSAPVRAAISPALSPCGRLKKAGSVIPSLPCPGRSEFRASAEPDGLYLIAARSAGRESITVFLEKSARVVEPQRSERRVPQNAGPDRGADMHAVVRRRDALAQEQLLQLHLVWALIIPQRPGVGK